MRISHPDLPLVTKPFSTPNQPRSLKIFSSSSDLFRHLDVLTEGEIGWVVDDVLPCWIPDFNLGFHVNFFLDVSHPKADVARAVCGNTVVKIVDGRAIYLKLTEGDFVNPRWRTTFYAGTSEDLSNHSMLLEFHEMFAKAVETHRQILELLCGKRCVNLHRTLTLGEECGQFE